MKKIDISGLDKNKKIVFFGIVPFALVMIVVVVVIISSIFNGPKEVNLEKNPFANVNASVLNVSSDVSLIDSKKSAFEYSRRDSIIKNIINEEGKEINVSYMVKEEDAKLNLNVGLNNHKEVDSTINLNVELNSSSKKEEKKEPVVQKTNRKEKINTTKIQKTRKPIQIITQEPKKEDKYNSYGISYKKEISTNSNKASNIDSESNIMFENNFMEAFLINDSKIKNGTQVTFILNENVEINGIKFKKMSRIFAVAQYSSNNVDIIGTIIQNTDGKKYPIKLVGYNENYQKGIFVEGRVEEAVARGTEKAIDDNINAIPNTELQLISNLINTGTETAKGAIKKEKEILINEGYKMNFKYENN